jgi:thioredoxin-related protein
MGAKPIEYAVLELVTYEDALILAKEQNRTVYILFTNKNCSWCEKQKKVLENLKISDTLKDNIVCYIDTDLEKEIAREYKVKSIPVHFIIDKDLNVIKKNMGYLNQEEFKKWISNLKVD